jgi:aspartyl aminopeptidase
MKSKYMDCQKIIKTLKHKDFIKISNNGEWFEDGAAVYVKEIKDNVFLLFVILKI